MSEQWQAELAEGFGSVRDLLDFLGIAAPFSVEAAGKFPFRVPRAYARKIRPGDPYDPLLRQVLPLGQELASPEGFVSDPVGDRQALKVPGLLHKYRGRALLITTGACAIHCRYCFRREFPYAESQFTRQREKAALDYIARDPELGEVILSGGDPLLLSNDRLARLTDQLAAIPHLRRLRIHSRVPLVLPSRIDDELLEVLAGHRLKTVVVIHANHPRELGGESDRAFAAMRHAGLALLNQAVLLKQVNDSVSTLCELSECLFERGVLPYYLHLLDRVRGTAHFEVPEAEARMLHEALRRRLPGYLVPRLVREIEGQPYKLPRGSCETT
ncbi:MULTISPECIES: EF-P beta-lysylation protein EpmB [Methylococcus]|uniref:L-lysine 2,3-aminomutase n=1 Tax=Methylococcus capsulatus TaxID=414 RepID=A0ABZ2F3Z6_METCP|nr:MULTISPECIES: EF-P beta-lysylation protein EpmB [Methylococcus]MDF9391982.1 EF-P beta-lysylation protein EpmB [Methylococcus capsulatus]